MARYDLLTLCDICFRTLLDVCSTNNWMCIFTKKFRTPPPGQQPRPEVYQTWKACVNVDSLLHLIVERVGERGSLRTIQDTSKVNHYPRHFKSQSLNSFTHKKLVRLVDLDVPRFLPLVKLQEVWIVSQYFTNSSAHVAPWRSTSWNKERAEDMSWNSLIATSCSSFKT